MSDRAADQRTPKLPGSFRHPLVVSATLRWADPVAPGIRKASDVPTPTGEYPDQLSISPPSATAAVPNEPLAQRMSRRLLERPGAAQ